MDPSLVFEVVTSIFFVLLGASATAFGYGFVGERLAGRFHWNPSFKHSLRWLGPLLILVSGAGLFFTLRA